MDNIPNPVVCARCGNGIPSGAPSAWCPPCALGQLLKNDSANPPTSVLSLRDIPQPGESVTCIGDYELLGVIAHGGMGVVYRARQRSLNRIVALKLLLGGECAIPEFKSQFKQESELAAQLSHPNIVPIYECGEHNGQPYYSMEYVPGSDLASLVRSKPMATGVVVEYARTIAEAIHYAHLQGVLHRDLKPSNVLLGDDNRLRIADFGLARRTNGNSALTLTGAVLGTPGFLPPEQVSAKHGNIGPHSDTYSIGAILYFLLTRHAPFEGTALGDVLRQVTDVHPIPPSQLNPQIPQSLEQICLRCLEKRAADRFSSAKELAKALAVEFHAGAAPSPEGRSQKAEKKPAFSKRNKLVAVIGMVTAFGLILMLGVAFLRFKAAISREFNPGQKQVSSHRTSGSDWGAGAASMTQLLSAKPVFFRIDSDPPGAHCFIYPKGMQILLSFDIKENVNPDEIPIRGRTPLGKVGGKVFSMHSLTGISGLEAFVFKPGFHPAIVSRNEPGEQVDWGIIKLTPLETEKPARVAVTNLLANPVSFVGHLVEMRGSLTRLDPKSELFRRVRRQLDARHSSIETIPEEAVIFSFSEPPYESVFMTFATPAKLASLDRAHDTLLEGVFEFYIPVTAYNAPMRRGGLVAELRGFQGR